MVIMNNTEREKYKIHTERHESKGRGRQDHENCDVNHDFHLGFNAYSDQNLTFGITKKIKKDPGEY